MDLQELLEWAEDNRQRREREGPWVGVHKAQRQWTSNQSGECFNCRGKGSFFTGYGWLICLDCDGKGRVIHCIACAGRGALWLGGSEYLDCPECNGTGAYKPKKEYNIPKGIVVASRNIYRERELEARNADLPS